MLKRVCNRCGKDASKYWRFIPKSMDGNYEQTLPEEAIDLPEWDFCEDCAEEITAFIKSNVRMGAKKTEKQVEKVTPLDKGKCIALYEAGWKTEDIAVELGVAERNVKRAVAGATVKKKEKKEWEWNEKNPESIM